VFLEQSFVFLHNALIHYDLETRAPSSRRCFLIEDSELHPNYTRFTVHFPQLDGLLDYGPNVFRSSEDVNNVDFSLYFGGDLKEAWVASFSQDLFDERVDRHDAVPVLLHV
jgi:hypothetical protein